MKKTPCMFILLVMIISSCQQKTKIAPVDLGAAKVAVTAFLDKYYSALNARDASACLSLFTDDALLCGTDPGEFWNKTEASKILTPMLADTSIKFNFNIDKREIRISRDGNSAIVVEQMIAKFISPKIPMRVDYHLVKNNETWQIDYCSDNLIPYNEDLAKLNKALE